MIVSHYAVRQAILEVGRVAEDKEATFWLEARQVQREMIAAPNLTEFVSDMLTRPNTTFERLVSQRALK